MVNEAQAFRPLPSYFVSFGYQHVNGLWDAVALGRGAAGFAVCAMRPAAHNRNVTGTSKTMFACSF